MTKYSQLNKSPYRQHMKIASLVRGLEPKDVLDVGCGSGVLSRYIADETSANVVGVESDIQAWVEASKLIEVHLLDLNASHLGRAIGGRKFDVIIFADVLEHLIDPEQVLRHVNRFLHPGGHVILSLPNILYYRLRINMLMGKFEYEEYGPLDKTHLRFFTFDSARRLVDNAGYSIENIEYSVKPASKIFDALAKILPGLFAYQFVMSLTTKDNK